MFLNHDSLTRTPAQAAATMSNRRRALRLRTDHVNRAGIGPAPILAEPHDRRTGDGATPTPWHRTHESVPTGMEYTSRRVTFLPLAVGTWSLDHLNTRPRLATFVRPAGAPMIGARRWTPMPRRLTRSVVTTEWSALIESANLQVERWREYCTAWLATEEGASVYADTILFRTDCQVRHDRALGKVRKDRTNAQARRRMAAMRARKAGKAAAPVASMSADDWARAHGVVLPDVGDTHTATEVSRADRRRHVPMLNGRKVSMPMAD